MGFNRFKISAMFMLTTMLILIMINEQNKSYADSINPGVFPIDSRPYGLSYEDWTIKFWQWLLSIPADKNPITDTTGKLCSQDQNASLPVFFLAFSTGGGATRTCDISAGKAILIPVNVVECSFAELNVKTEEELHTCATEDESSNPQLFLSVDGREFKDLAKYRVHSRAFDIGLPNNSVIQVSGPTRAVSDGYWIILEPLSTGKHDIHFKASLGDPTTGILTYSDDLRYTINIK
jgi:hypothetical protein